MNLSVLMIIRATAHSSPGGDTTQVLMTAKYLKELGVKVDIKLANEVQTFEGYDILHFFNIIRPDDILPFIRHTTIPICISTIFVDYTEYEKNERKGLSGKLFKILNSDQIEYLKAIARWVKNGDKIKSKYYLLRGHRAAMKKVAKRAALLLPNSDSEAARFFEHTRLSFPYRKIVYAIDTAIFNDNVTPNEQYKDHILCVGRIEGRKNQLNLIKALINTDLQLTIIGKPSPNHIEYYNACKSLAATAKNIHFLEEHIHQEELAGIYKAAKVHVLPSWFETAGLSSLEAGVMGCNIVITDKGDTEEYFGDMAYYCVPDDISSIKNAVFNAFNAPLNPMLKSYILNHYTWQHTAQQTLEAYKAVISKTL